MNAIILSTKRRWSWKTYFVLVGLNILAVLAYKIYRSAEPNASASFDWSSIIVMMIEYIACTTIGLFLAKRIGLGLPFVEEWGKCAPGSMNFRKMVAIAWVIGVGVSVLLLTLSLVVFGPPMQVMFDELGIPSPEPAEMSPLHGFLTSFYAGITEETFCRLAGLTLVAWLGSLLFHHPDGRPKLGILWLANILLALVFGFGHLQTVAGWGWPMNTLVVTRTLLLNGIAGLVFGWLYWRYGLESAILAHFFADIISQVVYPFVFMWQAEASEAAVLAIAVAVILLTMVLAVRSLRTGKLKAIQGETLKAT